MKVNKSSLLKESNEMMCQIYNKLSTLKTIALNQLNPKCTMLVIIDMNNGFAKGGALYSPRIRALIPTIENLTKAAVNLGIYTLAITDSHTPTSPEFSAYLRHSLACTHDSEVISELLISGVKVIPKNSTNGFLSPDFYIPKNINNVIVVGDDTDICIYQFSITLKAYFNQLNKFSNVIIPMNGVNTFNSANHSADFYNYVFLNSLIDNGISVVKEITIC